MQRKNSFSQRIDFMSSKSLNVDRLHEHEKKARASGLIYVGCYTMENN